MVLVSGTNGKTTTTKLLAAALARPRGRAGARWSPTCWAPTCPRAWPRPWPPGRPGHPAVLEVDEAWLGRVAAQVRPSVLVLLNLSRDQLDRNNEVRHVAQRWRQACREATGAVVVANADDPLVAWAARQGGKGHMGRRRPALAQRCHRVPRVRRDGPFQ